MTIVESKWIPGLPEVPYRGGVGAWEGVVLHFTDNYKSTIDNEVAYMTNNWPITQAFVHEFVSADRAVQTANPDYKCWGAGPANSRFISIELCVAKSVDEFERSFELYCQRAAWYLSQRGLSVEPAQADGSGTLWSHADVSKYLGGTHTDPIQYLKGWGKSWQDVLDRVAYYVRGGDEEVAESPFPDVPADHWAASAVKVVKDAGIMTGYEDGTFQGDKPITRYEMAMIVNDLLFIINNK